MGDPFDGSRYRDYLPPEERAAAANVEPKVYQTPAVGTGSVLVYAPSAGGPWRAIWHGEGDRHESTALFVFADIMRWAFSRTDQVFMAELHTESVGGPSKTRLAPLPDH